MTSWVTNKFDFVYKRTGLGLHRLFLHTHIHTYTHAHIYFITFKKWHTTTQRHTCNKPRTLQQVQTTIFDVNHLQLPHRWALTALLWPGKTYLLWQETNMHVNYASSLKHNLSKECHLAIPTAPFEPICLHHYSFLIRLVHLPPLFHNAFCQLFIRSRMHQHTHTHTHSLTLNVVISHHHFYHVIYIFDPPNIHTHSPIPACFH